MAEFYTWLPYIQLGSVDRGSEIDDGESRLRRDTRGRGCQQERQYVGDHGELL